MRLEVCGEEYRPFSAGSIPKTTVAMYFFPKFIFIYFLFKHDNGMDVTVKILVFFPGKLIFYVTTSVWFISALDF